LEVGSRETGDGRRELEVGSWKSGVGSRETGVGSRESGVGREMSEKVKCWFTECIIQNRRFWL